MVGRYLLSVKRELSPKEVLAVPCPTCGAAPKEKCELSTGQPRTEPHRDRRLIAADARSEMSSGMPSPIR
jgi:hypothetical protein